MTFHKKLSSFLKNKNPRQEEYFREYENSLKTRELLYSYPGFRFRERITTCGSDNDEKKYSIDVIAKIDDDKTPLYILLKGLEELHDAEFMRR